MPFVGKPPDQETKVYVNQLQMYWTEPQLLHDFKFELLRKGGWWDVAQTWIVFDLCPDRVCIHPRGYARIFSRTVNWITPFNQLTKYVNIIIIRPPNASFLKSNIYK